MATKLTNVVISKTAPFPFLNPTKSKPKSIAEEQTKNDLLRPSCISSHNLNNLQKTRVKARSNSFQQKITMMFRIQFLSTVLLVTAMTAFAELRGASSTKPSEHDDHRQLMMDKNGGGGGTVDFANGGTLEELHDCVGWENRFVQGSFLNVAFNNPNSEATCLTNTCPDGCCRMTSAHELQCMGNDFPQLPVRMQRSVTLILL